MARHTDNNNTDKSNEVDSTTDKVQRRRIMKHMVEKRRRNRINDCLENMRILVLKAQNKNPENYTKMEKADILEMTTNFLYVLNQQKSASAHVNPKHSTPSHSLSRIPTASSSSSIRKGEAHSTAMVGEYLKGFSTCQADVTNYIQNYGLRQSIPATSRGFPSMVSPPSVTSPPSAYGHFVTSTPYGNLNLVNKSAFRKPEATSTCSKVPEKDVNSNQRDFCVSTTSSHDHVTPVCKRRRSDSDVHLYLENFEKSMNTSNVVNSSLDCSGSSLKLDDSYSKADACCSKDNESSMEVSQSNEPTSSTTSNSNMWRPW